MLNTLNNISDSCQSPTGPQSEEPPIASGLTEDETRLLEKANHIVNIQNHAEKKKECDSLLSQDAPLHQLTNILEASDGLRQKLKDTLSPAVTKMLTGIHKRITAEARARIGQSS